MSLIYFMRRADGVGAIKIGCSKVPERRLRAHQVWAPEVLEIAATAPGNFLDEQRIHREFAEYRLHGEWFEASRPVLALLARVVATGQLPPPPVNDKYQRIEQMYRGGATLQAIGKEFGVTRQRIEQILRKAGVPSFGRRKEHCRRVVTPQIENEIVRLGRRGLSGPEIAKNLGIDAQNVRIYLKRHGVTVPRKKRERRPQTIDIAFAVTADYRAGLKAREIAEKHGIDAPHIYRLIRIAGVKPTRKPRVDLTSLGGEVVEQYRDGATCKQLAEKFDTTPEAIRRRVRAAGAARTREQNEAVRIAAVKAANARRRAC